MTPSRGLRFHEPRLFLRLALQMTIAGGVAGVGWCLLARAGSSVGGVALLGVAVALAALAPGRRRWSELALRTALVAVGALTLWIDGRWGQVGFALGFAAALSAGQRRARFALGLAAGTALTLLAGGVVGQINTAAALRGAPDAAVMALSGAVFGLIATLTLALRHLVVTRDAVAAAHAATMRDCAGELRALVDRGHGVWTEAAPRLPADDSNRAALEAGVLRLFEVARRWRASEPDAAHPSRAALHERLADLERRSGASVDAVSRDQYRMARDAVAEQLRYLDSIDTSRDRVIARMHNYLAAMERLRLAAIRLDTATASRDAVEAAPLAASLAELGADLDAAAEPDGVTAVASAA